MISQNTIQQVVQHIDIYDVISGFIQLKRRGSNYLGLCPFHNEKTPSFTVSPSKEIYKCFGCGKSGNAIQFIMEHEKYNYVEAIKWLANRYHIEIEELNVSPEYKLQQQDKESLFIINKFAQQYFEQQLWNTELGKTNALSYLKHRGFLQSTLEKFQIGYSPNDWNALSNHLLTNQFNLQLVKKTGLITEKTDGQFIDTYRDRITFPIHNHTGKIIGFGARIIGKNDKTAKYINTPENELYSKSNVLYGLYLARNVISQLDECLLVEGYTDVISLHQAGIENVVASGGTALTVNQIRLIKKITKNLTIIYDGDKAGIKAALRGLDIALSEGIQVQLLLIPDNEDPDSYVYKIGAKAFNEFIQKEKKDFLIFQLDLQLNEVGDDVNKKMNLVNQIAESISKITRLEDFTKKQHYIQKCAELLKISHEELNKRVNELTNLQKENDFKKNINIDKILSDPTIFENERSNISNFEAILLSYPDYLQEKNLLNVLIEHGLKEMQESGNSCAEFIIFGLKDKYSFSYPPFTELYKEYITLFMNHQYPNFKSFLYHPKDEIRKYFEAIIPLPNQLSENWNKVTEIKPEDIKIDYKVEVISSLNYFRLKKIKTAITENQKLMQSAKQEEIERLIIIHNTLKELEKENLEEFGTAILK